jgi:hypothetical protein
MKQKGGSVASDSVTSLVSSDAYTKMNTGFTNNFANGQCGGRLKLASKCATCNNNLKLKRGGAASLEDFMKSLSKINAMATKLNFTNSDIISKPIKKQVKPSSAKVKERKTRLTQDKKKKSHEGGSMNVLSAQNVGNSYTLRNKKGGFANPNESMGLSYNSIQYQGNNNGAGIEKSFSSQNIPNKILATEQVPHLPLLQKFINYGAPTPTDTKLPFSYNSVKHVGGKKKKTLKNQ